MTLVAPSSLITSNTIDQWQQKAQSGSNIAATNLMVVAHPDDETIFGFSELYSANKLDALKWKVVCAAPREVRSR